MVTNFWIITLVRESSTDGSAMRRMTRDVVIPLLLLFAMLMATGSAHAASPAAPKSGDKEIAGLTDQHGVPIRMEQLFGKPAVVHFGFTHCPDVCPAALDGTAHLMKRLGADAERMNFVFITVDPERDTAAVLKDYIAYFDKRIIGITGSEKAIAAIAKSFGTKYAKRPYEDSYTMDHTIYAYLKDTAWKTVGTLYLGASANQKLIDKRVGALLGK